MVNKKLIDALKQIARDLSTHKIKWVLVGSLSLALQGVRIDPKDIDILTDKEGALKLNKIWEKYKIKNVEFGETDRFRSYFGKFKIKDVKIEVMGDLEEKLRGKWFSLAKRLESPKFMSEILSADEAYQKIIEFATSDNCIPLGITSMEAKISRDILDTLNNESFVLLVDIIPAILKSHVNIYYSIQDIDVNLNDLYWIAEELGII